MTTIGPSREHRPRPIRFLIAVHRTEAATEDETDSWHVDSGGLRADTMAQLQTSGEVPHAPTWDEAVTQLRASIEAAGWTLDGDIEPLPLYHGQHDTRRWDASVVAFHPNLTI